MKSLAERMKEYEDAYRFYLPKRMPIIIRIDGKSFHTLLGGAEKPFDNKFMLAMNKVGKKLFEEISGTMFLYIQSDEFNLFLNTYQSLGYEPYFDNNLQKLVSISASIASAEFNREYDRFGVFDARAFILPKEEVINYFIWRQQDWIRNSLTMLARSHFSHRELEDKNSSQIHDMLFLEKEVNWADLPDHLKNGRVIYRKEINKNDVIRNEINLDQNIPIFTKNREFLEKYINYGEIENEFQTI